MNKPEKILLLGDYSNCHQSLAHGLRQLGCEVVVASDQGKWRKFNSDIKISRHKGKISGLYHYLKMQSLLRGKLSGFDIVAVHDPIFTHLRPRLLYSLLNQIKKRNGSLFLTSMSEDTAYLGMLAQKDSPLRYNEWFVDGKPSRHHIKETQKWSEWQNPELVDYEEFAFDQLDGAVTVLYEYQLGMLTRLSSEKVAYGGIPIAIENFEPIELPDRPDKVKFFLGRDRTRKLVKGTDYLEIAARNVVERYPDKAELIIVENKPFDEFLELMKSSHVVLDQIYSYTPATTALMAMAFGLNVVSGAEPEYYNFIHEHDNRPIINAPIEIEPLERTLEEIVVNSRMIRERGIRSREFVMKHNESKVVAKRFLDFWNERRLAKP